MALVRKMYRRILIGLLILICVIVFAGIYFYCDLVIHYVCLVFYWFFKDSEDTRNVIYFFAAVIGVCFLFWRTKIALREANISEQNFKITEQNIKITEQNIKTIEQKMVYEQISHAIEQLDGKKLFIRLNGISDLKKIATDNEGERRKIARILVSFIQIHATKGSEEKRQDPVAYRKQRLDIEAAIHALANIASEIEKQGQFREQHNETKYSLCDLQGADLRGLRFHEVDLSKFNLISTDMSAVRLSNVNLSEADLRRRLLKGGVKFNDAYMENVNFYKARLNYADFSNAYVGVGNFISARLWCVIFTGTIFNEVKFKVAELNDADLTDAEWTNMPDIQQYQIDKAFRWEGHDTVVISSNNHKFKPPPEKKKPTEKNLNNFE